MSEGLIIFLCVVGIVAAIILLRFASSDNAFSPYRSKRLLTRHEVVMYEKLERALSGTPYIICSQVSMGAIMDIKANVSNKKRLGLRNKFDRKIVDFVIVDREGRARVLIELDDSSHNPVRDAARDALTASA